MEAGRGFNHARAIACATAAAAADSGLPAYPLAAADATTTAAAAA